MLLTHPEAQQLLGEHRQTHARIVEQPPRELGVEQSTRAQAKLSETGKVLFGTSPNGTGSIKEVPQPDLRIWMR